MRAIGIHKFGGREVLQQLDLAVPEPAADEILIKLAAAGVNPVDWKIREGLLVERLPHQFPLVLGWDAAGVVERCGTAAQRLPVGSPVFAYCRKPVIQWGCYAEYVTVPESSAALMPPGLPFAEAAAIPLASLTAYQTLFDAAGLQSGERVLIQAAAGGVGGFAMQLAAQRGAETIGVAGPENQDYLKELGAALALDYTSTDLVAALRDTVVDVALDCVGGGVLRQCAEILRPRGRLVTILQPEGIDDLVAAKELHLHYVFVAPNGRQLDEIAQLAADGCLRSMLAQTFPLTEAARAHELSESGHVRGKLALMI